MKSVILFALFIAAAVAAPLDSDKTASVIRSELTNIGVDGFNTVYETSNGIAAQADGQLLNVGTENEALVIRGQFSYVGDDGKTYAVSYVADQNGFHPVGEHLPTNAQ